jgi:hypothetical protein
MRLRLRPFAAAAALALALAGLPQAAAAEGQPVPGSVSPAVARASKLAAKARDSQLPVTLVLKPGSTTAGRQAVETFMAAQGFQLSQRLIRNTGLRYSGTVSQVEATFSTQINDYRSGGRIFHANATPVVIPPAIAPYVAGVADLDDSVVMKPLGNPIAIGPSGGATPPYTPSQLAHFYNLDALFQNSTPYDGSGTKIGIITFATFSLPDVRGFQKAVGQAQGTINVTVAPALGGKKPGTDTSGTTETTLDVTWSSAMAPGAEIDVVEASNGDWIGAFNTMFELYDPDVISISWGACDVQVSGGTQDTLHTALTNLLAGHNIPILIASGDDGSKGCGDDSTTSASWPASDPAVVAVGGTRINADSYGDPSAEVAWNCGGCGSTSGSSGGGYSNHFSRPGYQSGAVSNANRGLPDVALLADPNTGFPLYYKGAWTTIGGTSAATPALAGILAVIADGGGSLANLLTFLYQHTSAMNDVTSGSNGDYTAAAGWDAVTGLGSVDARKLYNALTGGSIAAVSSFLEPSSGAVDDSAMTFAGSDWATCKSGSCAKAYNKTVHIGGTAGDSVALRFTGTAVTLRYGTNFDGGTVSVSIDGSPASPATINENAGQSLAFASQSYSSLSAGTHTITATLVSGAKIYIDAILLAPSVSTVSPQSGPATGNAKKTVLITGSGFTGATAVNFGATQVASGNFTVVSDTQIKVAEPAGTGLVHVTVDSPSGTGVGGSGTADQYGFTPVVASLSKPSAATGTTVIVKGTNFKGADQVCFGASCVTLSSASTSDTAISVAVPSGSGTVPVTVHGPGGTSDSSTAPSFSYAPYIKDLGATYGSPSGGKTLTITGTGLSNADAVAFGSPPASAPQGTSLTHGGDTKLTVTTPAGTGVVDVFVHGPGGWSLAAASGKQFSYAPIILSASPLTGSAGTAVKIKGSNLSAVTSILFGGDSVSAPAAGTAHSDTGITVSAPTPASLQPDFSGQRRGIVPITAVSPGGVSAVAAKAVFTYT